MMYTCKTCGYKVKNLGQMNSHYADKHPERYEKASATHRKHNQENKKALKEQAKNNNKLSGDDLLEILKVKRDALNEVIQNMEKMLK